jgi:uncharacterized DUF497 family protein
VKVSGFDWDHGNTKKCQKHGLSLDEVEKFFEQKLLVGPDIKHSQDEERFIGIGKIRGKLAFVAFTFRNYNGETLIRPVSARFMRKKEVAKHEKAFAKIKNR